MCKIKGKPPNDAGESTIMPAKIWNNINRAINSSSFRATTMVTEWQEGHLAFKITATNIPQMFTFEQVWF